MKILVINCYVRENTGDAAQVSVLLKQLKELFPKAEVQISGMEDPGVHPVFENAANVGSMRLYSSEKKIGRVPRILRKLIIFAVGLIWPHLPDHSRFTKLLPHGMRGELSAIELSDLVISAGGGYLNAPDSLDGNINIYFRTLPIRLAAAFGKKIIMAPQSYGPLGNEWQRDMVKKALKNVHLVYARESISRALLQKLGVKKSSIVLAPDLAFSFTANELTPPKQNNNQLTIGITARQWLTSHKQAQYEQALASFIVEIERFSNAKVILIPQVVSDHESDDDRIVETRIYNLARGMGGHPVQILDYLNHHEIKKLYSTLDFTIGTRFHSIIFSLTSYVPSIAIEYEHKTSGIMQDLRLRKWVIKIEDVESGTLMKLFNELVAQKSKYITHLHAVLPDYTKNAKILQVNK